MDSGPTLKHKVTVKFNHLKTSTPARPPSRSNVENIPSRPASPAKSYVTTSSVVEPAAFRPKAKVNSSATTRKAATIKSPTIVTSNVPSRPGSPSKLTPRLRNGVTSPTTGPSSKVPSTSRGPALRSPPAVSAPVTPELRNRSLTNASGASSSISPLEDTRSRTGSVSLHHAASFSVFPKPPPMGLSVSERNGSASASSSPRMGPSRSVIGIPDRGMASSPSLRIRSKVTSVAKPADTSAPPTPTTLGPSPAFPSGRSQAVRARTASISSNLSQQLGNQMAGSPPSQQFYPITTASPAANPHRFQSSRPPPRTISPPSVNQIFQSFSQQPPSKLRRDESPSPRNRAPQARVASIQAKVDPASIPLPPLSPPASSVSFSSRSSASRSSVSVIDDKRPASQSSSASSRLSPASTQQQNGNMDHLKSTLDNLMDYTSGLPSAEDDDASEDQGGDDERKVKATAKSKRKIADLEITNRSLLAINSSLEATKHRQAKEIRELKRKLRESRLILPPSAYRAVKSSLDPSEIADDEEDVDDGDDSQEDEAQAEKDEIYQRIKMTIEGLVKSGQRALERQVSDFPEGGKGSAKVLTAEEVEDWHQSSVTDGDPIKLRMNRLLQLGNDTLHDDNDSSYASIHQYDTDDLDVSFDQSNQSLTSEDEVESMTILPGSPSSSPPPIFITKPS
ncbi:hypothetical protein CPB83DRAFT_47987 [Crepidotus variabilis]|uniref:Uncharacterized protein n=1 Tax=Crepidotus variabilis TaxID=179855 RepID=A0A9P6EN46_9AGAR|nr:hypothetical protein CPB83DRAFT_47987 [Crepidotus variabilis]